VVKRYMNEAEQNSQIQGFFLVLLGLELRASPLLGKGLFHLSHAPSPFCSGYFGDRVSLFVYCLFVLPAVSGMTGVYH
jgi:hypothetical protein